tara:strand:- start:140 stop:946 length:807 start_codon:yes stop_codon:yes gene_type:complete
MAVVMTDNTSTDRGVIYTANGQVWRGWVDQTGGASTTATTSGTASVWGNWNTAATNTVATIGTGDPFIHWVSGSNAATVATTTHTVTWGNWVNQAQVRVDRRERVEANEEVRREAAAAHERRRETWRLEREETARKKKAADERAMQLLRGCLTRDQNEDLANHGHFFVSAPSGRMYRIDKGRHGNIKAVDPLTKKWYESLCVAPRGVPAGDAMLMQKLMIETAEEVLRSYSNITKKDGGYVSGEKGSLTGEKLSQILHFPTPSERQAA